MNYPWVVVGNKVQYIGPNFLQVVHNMEYIRSPLNNEDVYVIETISFFDEHIFLAVENYAHLGSIHVSMFRPLEDKDIETFNAMLTNIPSNITTPIEPEKV